MTMTKIKTTIRNAMDFIFTLCVFGNIKLMFNLLRSIQMTSYCESQFLFRCARDGYGKGWIVEIGSCTGRSTIAMALGSKLKMREKIYSVDPQADLQIRKTFEQNIKAAKIADYVAADYLKSEDAVKKFDGHIRLLFIDGSHEYEDVKKDILLWKKFLIDGAIVALHDYQPAGHPHYSPGVNKAVEECILNSNEFVVEAVMDCIFIVSKKRSENKKLIDEFRKFNAMRSKLKAIIDKSFLQVKF